MQIAYGVAEDLTSGHRIVLKRGAGVGMFQSGIVARIGTVGHAGDDVSASTF